MILPPPERQPDHVLVGSVGSVVLLGLTHFPSRISDLGKAVPYYGLSDVHPRDDASCNEGFTSRYFQSGAALWCWIGFAFDFGGQGPPSCSWQKEYPQSDLLLPCPAPGEHSGISSMDAVCRPSRHYSLYGQ